jgi:hypothetical protein
MARDEREEEQRFLAELQARTGRSLHAWMEEISARGFSDKNEAIDWLRAQGFPFARASWLERIHSNGGRPIYPDEADSEPPDRAPPERRPAPPPPPRPLQPAETAQLAKLVAAAKGYQPLYHLLAAAIGREVPGVVLAPKAAYISIAAPREFAALTLHASELRLGLDLGDRAADARVQKSRLKGPGPAITHMVVLTDAREVNADLMGLVHAANARVNG